tara:strand:+ start:25896 stop:26135 length:240 start_codon:yes stop_codon:yes gene_type:complete
MYENIFNDIKKMRDILIQNIGKSNADIDNINKAKKIHNELGIMLDIWTDKDNVKTLSKEDIDDIFNTSKLIIKKANDLL